jgi:hypothetical protein
MMHRRENIPLLFPYSRFLFLFLFLFLFFFFITLVLSCRWPWPDGSSFESYDRRSTFK